MILKLSLTVLLLYYLAVLWKYYRQDIAGIFGTCLLYTSPSPRDCS